MAKKRINVPGIGFFDYDNLTNYITQVDNPELESQANPRHISLPSVIWDKSFEELKEAMNHNLKSLVLQLTRRCNLRCDYCAYSGAFSNMLPHTDMAMSHKHICKSIDFFMEHSLNSKELMIIFYGGEPLTEFDSIVLAVDYAKHFARNIRFGISSNGVLIDERVLSWLEKNPEVYLTVTINGEQHDLYRKRADGSGSLVVILNNMLRIKSDFPEVWENQIRFISNINSMNEIYNLRTFYSKVLEKNPSMISKINLDYCAGEVADKYNKNKSEERIISEKIIDEFIETNDSFLGVLYNERLNAIHNRGICKQGTPGYIGSCMPLSRRLFVRADGSFNMCEKVTDMLSLGDLESGFNYKAVEKLYYQLERFCNNKCRNCWAQRFCMFCYQDFIDDAGGFRFDFPDEKCEIMKEDVEAFLKIYIRFSYSQPDILT